MFGILSDRISKQINLVLVQMFMCSLGVASGTCWNNLGWSDTDWTEIIRSHSYGKKASTASCPIQIS